MIEGWHKKYDVRRTDGTDEPGGRHFGCVLFVLDLTHDMAARNAMRRYVQLVEMERPALAADIVQMLRATEKETTA
mgnify:CR=1 FL=1